MIRNKVKKQHNDEAFGDFRKHQNWTHSFTDIERSKSMNSERNGTNYFQMNSTMLQFKLMCATQLNCFFNINVIYFWSFPPYVPLRAMRIDKLLWYTPITDFCDLITYLFPALHDFASVILLLYQACNTFLLLYDIGILYLIDFVQLNQVRFVNDYHLLNNISNTWITKYLDISLQQKEEIMKTL
jgi:hypothetical protein